MADEGELTERPFVSLADTLEMPALLPAQFATSPKLDKLIPALIAVQATIKPAVKATDNAFFKSKYADLTAVMDVCREALIANRFAVIQSPEPAANGGVALRTLLIHESGQWVQSYVAAAVTKADSQAVGSATSYLRRYSIAALVGVVTQGEDDDGNAASGNAGTDAGAQSRTQRGGRGTAAAGNARAGASRTEGAPPASPPPSTLLDDAAASDLEMLANDAGVAVGAILDKYKVAKLTELTVEQGLEATAKLSKRIHDAKVAATKGAA